MCLNQADHVFKQGLVTIVVVLLLLLLLLLLKSSTAPRTRRSRISSIIGSNSSRGSVLLLLLLLQIIWPDFKGQLWGSMFDDKTRNIPSSACEHPIST